MLVNNGDLPWYPQKKSPTKQIQEIDWDHPIYGKSTVCPEQKTKSVPSWWFQRVFGSWREVTSKRVYDFGSLPGAPTRGGAAVFNHLEGFSEETVRPWEPFFFLKGDLNGDVF